jgi:hypothetical protein
MKEQTIPAHWNAEQADEIMSFLTELNHAIWNKYGNAIMDYKLSQREEEPEMEYFDDDIPW